MITQWYPKVRPVSEVVALTVTGASEIQRAKKRGIGVEEYRKRVKIVSETIRQCSVKVGDVVFPSQWKEFMEYGRVTVMAICYHYDDYGNVTWNEKTPFLLAVSPTTAPSNIVNCTVDWVQHHQPSPTEETAC